LHGAVFLSYNPPMLNGITFWTDDAVWRHILVDLGAEFAEKKSADVVFSSGKKLSPLELKQEILRLASARENEVIKKICGDSAPLSGPQRKILVALHRAGPNGVAAEDLQQQLGYASDAATNAVNTAIYQLRKILGRDFIINDNGKYKLG